MCRYHPAEPPPSPRDENFVFVTKQLPPEPSSPDPVAGQRADCRGQRRQFSSRDFPIAQRQPNPLLIAASYAHLKFSYRTILQWRIRFACRLIAGAEIGRIFRHETEKPATPVRHGHKTRGNFLYENRFVIRRQPGSVFTSSVVCFGMRLCDMQLGLCI